MSERRALGKSPEVAAYLGVPVRTLDMWSYRGTGPRFVKVGRHRRYRWEDVERWLEQRSSDGGAAA
jgi:excisionase family DNA binding protein